MATVCVQRTPVMKGLDNKPDIFMGDDESLVDRLIASCEAHKTFTPDRLLPGFGRDLVPYFEEGEFEASATAPTARPVKQPSSTLSKGQKRSQGERPAGKRSPEKSRVRRDGPQQPTAAAEVPRSPTPARDVEPPRGRTPRAAPAADKRLQPQPAAQRITTAPRVAAGGVVKKQAAVVEKQWAGPCFHASPEPESLPMPGALLFPSGNSLTVPTVDACATLVLKSLLQVSGER